MPGDGDQTALVKNDLVSRGPFFNSIGEITMSFANLAKAEVFYGRLAMLLIVFISFIGIF